MTAFRSGWEFDDTPDPRAHGESNWSGIPSFGVHVGATSGSSLTVGSIELADPGEEVDVICPDCLNANRNARRRCKSQGGMCGGTGFVGKRVSR